MKLITASDVRAKRITAEVALNKAQASLEASKTEFTGMFELQTARAEIELKTLRATHDALLAHEKRIGQMSDPMPVTDGVTLWIRGTFPEASRVLLLSRAHYLDPETGDKRRAGQWALIRAFTEEFNGPITTPPGEIRFQFVAGQGDAFPVVAIEVDEPPKLKASSELKGNS